MGEKIIKRGTVEMYQEDMVKYAIIVNRRRAFPEVRDGLKPVQRRALYDMLVQHAMWNHKIKVQAITGDVSKWLHPHGDSSVYTCLVSLAPWFKCKVPLVAGQGNWGTVMGDAPAKPRYLEAGLSEFAYDCIIGELKDSKGIVNWLDNYLRDKKEPEYLPVKVPILLINGSFGIGLGMQINIPPHNIVDVINETRAMIRDPEHQVVLIPDHCQNCDILDADWKTISNTGRGSYKVRGKMRISEDKKGYPTITIYSLPDDITTEMIVDSLEAMIEKKQLPMIKDIDDQSAETVDLVITLKKGSDPNYVKQVLITKTRLQDTVSVNFEAVDGIEPRRYNYTEYIRTFLHNRSMVKFRWYCNKLKDNLTRWHQLNAYITAIESGKLDDITRMVRKQKTIDNNQLVESLIKMLKITDLEAKFILSTSIAQLSEGHLLKYKKEADILAKEQPELRRAITDDGSIIMNEIDQELAEIAAKYNYPRTCRVISKAESNGIPKGTFKVVITEKNYLRKIPDTDKVGIVRKDNPKFILRVDNAENILLFDNKGKVFKLPVHKIPVTDKASAGVDIRMLSKNLTSDIIAVYYEPDIKKIISGRRKHYLAVVTKDNLIKKMDMEDFGNVNLSGLIYTKLREESDEVVGIAIVPSNLDVVIYSKQKALRSSVDQIPIFKRNASGSKAMSTDSPLEGISVMYPDVESIVVITEKGYINKFPVSGLTQKDRAKGGSTVIRLKEGDSILSIYGVNEKDKIHIVTTDGPIEIPVSDLKSKSSIAAGQKMLKNGTVIVRCDIIY